MNAVADASAKVSPLAGKPATPAMLLDAPRLVTAYYGHATISGLRPAGMQRSFPESLLAPWSLRLVFATYGGISSGER
jgi:hypothetical protein